VNGIGVTLAEAIGAFRDQAYDVEVIVVADGDDGTRELVQAMAAREPRLRVVGQRERRGKGRGIREGVASLEATSSVSSMRTTRARSVNSTSSSRTCGTEPTSSSVRGPCGVAHRPAAAVASKARLESVRHRHACCRRTAGHSSTRNAASSLQGRRGQGHLRPAAVDGYMFDRRDSSSWPAKFGTRRRASAHFGAGRRRQRLQLVRGNLKNLETSSESDSCGFAKPAPRRGSIAEEDEVLRALIVSINYAPEQTGFGQHVAALAKSLAAGGHAVTVLTGFSRFSPQWRRWPEYRVAPSSGSISTVSK